MPGGKAVWLANEEFDRALPGRVVTLGGTTVGVRQRVTSILADRGKLAIGDGQGESWSRGYVALLVTGLVAAALLRVALLPTEVYRADLDVFAGWTHQLATTVPLGKAYDIQLSYGPVMAYVFWVLGLVQPAFQTATDASDPLVRASLKVPMIAADLATAVVLVWALRGRPAVAVGAGLALALVPVTWYVSAAWGQCDAIFTVFSVLAAVLAARGRRVAAGVALGLALGTKAQALTFLVPLAAYAWGRLGTRGALIPAVATVGTFVVLWVPFIPAGGPAAYLDTIYGLKSETYAALSVNAWNPWWILQWRLGGESLLPDNVPILGPLTPRTLGYVAAGIGFLAVFAAVRQRPTHTALFIGLTASVLVGFCLLTGMHERYSYPTVALLAVLLGRGRIRPLWLILAAVISANLIVAAPPGGGEFGPIPLWGPISVIGSVAMTLMLVAILWQLLTETRAVPDSAGRGARTSTH